MVGVTDESRIKKNASMSILLKMPGDVLDSILRFLLGDRMIHICHFQHYELKQILPTSAWRAVPNHGSLVSAFCVANQSEQQAYDEAIRPGVFHSTEDPDYIQTCKDRHKHCLMCNLREKRFSVAERRAGRLTFTSNLSVLAVCRQLYQESNNILWQSNTFSFDDSFAFQSFLAGMNSSQKHKLRKIHISTSVIVDETLFKAIDFVAWANAISPRVLAPLKNLNMIHLSFDQYTNSSDPSLYPSVPMSHAASHDRVIFKMETMLGLRLLPWKDRENANRGKHVTVVVGDGFKPYSDSVTPRWTKAQKLDAAEDLRARLAAPDAAAIHVIEEKAAMMAKEDQEQQQNEKNGRAYVRYRQHLISKLEPKVESARAEVEARETDEALRNSEHADASGKGPTNEKLYSYRTAIHMNARKNVEKMAAKLARMKADVADMQAHPENLRRKDPPLSAECFYHSD
ncbi:hypothetical protein BDR22DRAFT_865427 [Usnea florida]